MGGKKPQVIMTDQDPAMRAAIEKVFGANTIHRSCLWHVMRKARDHLGVLYGAVQGFKDEFFAVIKFSWTIADFEANWQAFLKKYKVDSNPYLKIMYDKRDEWAAAYFCDTFCTGMSTTQRSESIKAGTKIWMDIILLCMILRQSLRKWCKVFMRERVMRTFVQLTRFHNCGHVTQLSMKRERCTLEPYSHFLKLN